MSDNKQGKTRQSPFVKFLVRSASGWPGFYIGAIFIVWGILTIPFWTVGVVCVVCVALLLVGFLSYSFDVIVIKPEEFLDQAAEEPFCRVTTAESLLYKARGQASLLRIYNRWAEPVSQELEEWIRNKKVNELLSEAKWWTGLADRLEGVKEALGIDPSCLTKAQERVQYLLKADTEKQKQLLDAQAVIEAQLDADSWYVRQAQKYLSEHAQVSSIKGRAEAMLKKIAERLAVYEKTGTYPAWE